MSRNKDIKFLHWATQKPYKECRRIMKDSHWNLPDAFGLISIDEIKSMNDSLRESFKSLEETTKRVCESIRALTNSFSEVANDR